jgi:hypothetical protein
MERVPEAGSSVEVAVALGEAAGADMASGPLDMPPVLAPAAAVPVGERPVAADAEMAEASALGASEEGAWKRDPSHRAAALSRGASDPFFVLDDEREEQSWDELRECAEATVGSLRSSLEVFCMGRPQDPPGNGFRHTFFVTKASFVTPCFLTSGSDGSERRQVVVHPPRGRYLGLAAIPEDLARRGYCTPLPVGRRGGGPSVALRRSESRGGSSTRRGGSGTRRGATTTVGVRPGRR